MNQNHIKDNLYLFVPVEQRKETLRQSKWLLRTIFEENCLGKYSCLNLQFQINVLNVFYHKNIGEGQSEFLDLNSNIYVTCGDIQGQPLFV